MPRRPRPPEPADSRAETLAMLARCFRHQNPELYRQDMLTWPEIAPIVVTEEDLF